LFAFMKKDFYSETSYKLSFLLNFLGIFFSIFTFYFISKLIGQTTHLDSYGGDYFSFALIGIAFLGFMTLGINGFSQKIRNGQTTGTLEYLMSTPTKISTILVGSSLWSFAFKSFHVLMYIIIGLLLGMNMSQPNILGAIIILILTIICFSGVGILSAGFILLFKKGDPINWLFSSFSALVGGAFYPITIMPEWLQYISHVLPITYSLRAVRHALLQGYSFAALAPDIIVLLVFSIILMPLGIYVFKLALNKAKKDGSLVKY